MAKAFSDAKRQEPQTANTIEPKHHGPDPQWYKDPSHRGKGEGGNSYSTPTRIQHHPSCPCWVWAPKVGVSASTPFLRILGQPLASNGDLSLVILRQEESPENLRY